MKRLTLEQQNKNVEEFVSWALNQGAWDLMQELYSKLRRADQPYNLYSYLLEVPQEQYIAAGFLWPKKYMRFFRNLEASWYRYLTDKKK